MPPEQPHRKAAPRKNDPYDVFRRPNRTTRAVGRLPDELPPVFTRTYLGKPSEIEVRRTADAAQLAGRGYYPISSDYLYGEWGGWAWAIALLLVPAVGLGLLIILYMLAVKPSGTLTVNYDPRGTGDANRRLRELDELHREGLVGDDEFEAKRSEIIGGL